MIPKGWQELHLTECLIGSSIRNKDNRLSSDHLRSVNKTEGMIPMKEQAKGNSVNKAKVVKRDWFAYNPMRLNIGSICRWGREEDCIVSPDYVVFRCNKKVLLTDYFDQYRTSHAWKSYMDNAGHGGVRIRIYLKDLYPLRIKLPPLSEQRKITEILLTWDKAISIAGKRLEKTTHLKRGLMQKLLAGELRFPGFKGSWRKVNLGDVSALTAGGTPSTRKHEYWNGDIPWMSSGEIHQKKIHSVKGRITESGLKNSSAKIVPKESVLIALAGQGKTRGTVALSKIELCTNQSVAAAMIDENHVLPEYLYCNLDNRYLELRSISAGDGGRGGLNLSILRSIQFFLPSLDEQKAISSMSLAMDSEINTLEKKLGYLKKEKEALIQQLLSGKKRVA